LQWFNLALSSKYSLRHSTYKYRGNFFAPLTKVLSYLYPRNPCSTVSIIAACDLSAFTGKSTTAMIFTTKPTYVTSRNIYNFSFETLTAEKLCTTRVQPYSYCMFLCDGKFKKDFLLHEMRCESHLGVSHLGMPNNIKTTCSDRSL